MLQPGSPSATMELGPSDKREGQTRLLFFLLLGPGGRAAYAVRMVSAVMEVPVREIINSETRNMRHVAEARLVSYLLVRVATGWSYPRIGKFFSRHHSVVLMGARRAMKLLDNG